MEKFNSLHIIIPIIYTDLEIKDSCLISNHTNLDPLVIPLFMEVGYEWKIENITNGIITIVKVDNGMIRSCDYKPPIKQSVDTGSASIASDIINQTGNVKPVDFNSAVSDLYVNSEQFIISFGKYSGQSIETILANNPQYIIWLHENKIRNLSFSNSILENANNELTLRRKYK